MRKIEPREHVIDAELANGNIDAWKQALGFPTTRREIERSRQWAADQARQFNAVCEEEIERLHGKPR